MKTIFPTPDGVATMADADLVEADAGGPLCGDCGNPCFPGQSRCGACQMRHEAQADVDASLAAVPPLVPQYSLATLFFSVTWIAVCLGSLKLNACLGMTLIFLTMPALLRTMALGLRDRESGLPSRPGKRMSTFFTSLGIMFLVLLVSGGIFATSVCLVLLVADEPTFLGTIQNGAAILALTLGVFGAFGAAAAILWYTRWLGA